MLRAWAMLTASAQNPATISRRARSSASSRLKTLIAPLTSASWLGRQGNGVRDRRHRLDLQVLHHHFHRTLGSQRSKHPLGGLSSSLSDLNDGQLAEDYMDPQLIPPDHHPNRLAAGEVGSSLDAGTGGKAGGAGHAGDAPNPPLGAPAPALS